MTDCKIDEIAPHTIKKIELVTEYVKTWAQKLLNNPYCEKLVFIDCMCNCGEYVDKDDNKIEGTGLRVVRYLSNEAIKYPNKKIYVELNDINMQRAGNIKSICSKIITSLASNFKLEVLNLDSSIFLSKISERLKISKNTHFLLFYDPYDARIDWNALNPFFALWGEIIINHMVSDTVRGINVASKDETIDKYQNTYGIPIQILRTSQFNANDFEKIFEENIKHINDKINRHYFLSCIPFFNSNNAILYYLAHYTTHEKGFKLFKSKLWHIFEGHSSGKNVKACQNQLTFDFRNEGAIHPVINGCYTINNMVDYLISKLKQCNCIALEDLWRYLDYHPVFISDGYRNLIKEKLKVRGYIIKNNLVTYERIP